MEKVRCYVDDRLFIVNTPAQQKAIVNVLSDDTVEIAFFEPIAHNQDFFAAHANRFLWRRFNYRYFKSCFPSAETCLLANQDLTTPVFWGCYTSSRANAESKNPSWITLNDDGLCISEPNFCVPNVYGALYMPLTQFRLINCNFDVNDYLFSSTRV